MSEQRCELTELLVRDCAHCRTAQEPVAKKTPFRTGPPPEPRHTPAHYSRDERPPLVMAIYEGSRCSNCGDEITIGDYIRSDEAGSWLGECCND